MELIGALHSGFITRCAALARRSPPRSFGDTLFWRVFFANCARREFKTPQDHVRRWNDNVQLPQRLQNKSNYSHQITQLKLNVELLIPTNDDTASLRESDVGRSFLPSRNFWQNHVSCFPCMKLSDEVFWRALACYVTEMSRQDLDGDVTSWLAGNSDSNLPSEQKQTHLNQDNDIFSSCILKCHLQQIF